MTADEFSLLAKLQSQLALNKVLILQNPIPYIEKQQREIFRLHKFLHEVEHAVSPDVVFDAAESMGISPRDFRGEELVKLNAVRSAIDKYHGATP